MLALVLLHGSLACIGDHNKIPDVSDSYACRLTTWLDQLGPKSADVLKSCMDLLAKGIVVPTAGAHALPPEAVAGTDHNADSVSSYITGSVEYLHDCWCPSRCHSDSQF